MQRSCKCADKKHACYMNKSAKWHALCHFNHGIKKEKKKGRPHTVRKRNNHLSHKCLKIKRNGTHWKNVLSSDKCHCAVDNTSISFITKTTKAPDKKEKKSGGEGTAYYYYNGIQCTLSFYMVTMINVLKNARSKLRRVQHQAITCSTLTCHFQVLHFN